MRAKRIVDRSFTVINTPPIPWSKGREWREVNRIFDYHVEFAKATDGQLEILAAILQKQFASLYPMMEQLGTMTCSGCPDPCCLTAKPWFDYKDLLYLHLLNLPIPPGQPITRLDGTCRYLRNRGCALARPVRPFICTWYCCPTQTRRLKNENRRINLNPDGSLARIKQLRIDLENRFIASLIAG